MNSGDNSLTVAVGNHELIVRQRYEALSIANDILIALWFIVGSALFFSPSTSTTATALFLIGSVQMIVRPLIRLTRRIHLGRIGSGEPRETARDF
ncbi:YrhK family protein [Frigoribacterium sp. UYMn621]|uniref:YrhK family protein n=1 Tax=Frigoribacterium sp. UYMn621 TaxID=3156343 RepID=UPI003399E745